MPEPRSVLAGPTGHSGSRSGIIKARKTKETTKLKKTEKRTKRPAVEGAAQHPKDRREAGAPPAALLRWFGVGSPGAGLLPHIPA